MNERFEHCLYEAGLTSQGCWDELGTYEQEAIEKFAELIIRECSLMCLEDKDSRRILQHFGVEE